ncbi:SDR family oxidoreductase [Streptomyces dioscori]|uniref:SDR family oxidoreductase n=1 Tax=Streptomyces dioscori TaxID=2109333 RepID=UPI00131BD77D|nr:SDR family oxidoreductase [Streptomyces dioscori]
MNTPGTMLITGATGVVGAELAEQARAAGWQVTGCSARGGTGATAWRMGEAPAPPELAGPWDVIVNAAARPRWNLPAARATAANVAPVGALAPLVGPRTHVIHVSTAYVTGLRGTAGSQNPDDFRNSYEWSKAAAEREAVDRYGATVVRPPLVIGRRSDGAVSRFTGLYSLIRSCVTGLLPAVVGDGEAFVETVTSCDVAACVLDLARDGRGGRDGPVGPVGPVGRDGRDGRVGLGGSAGQPVVLGTGEDACSVKELVEVQFRTLNTWRAARGCGPLEIPTIVTPEQWDRFYLPFARPHLTARQLHAVELLSAFIPYMSTHEPIGVTRRVPPVGPALRTCVEAWADRHPRLAQGHPAPWVGEEET